MEFVGLMFGAGKISSSLWCMDLQEAKGSCRKRGQFILNDNGICTVWRRQFCMELNGLAVRLQGECQPDSCTQMTATEQWIFLCAAHKTPKECPAIDYTRHTLDGAACLLNSNKYFPSR